MGSKSDNSLDVLAVVRFNQPITAARIREITNLSFGTVHSTLSRLIKSNHLVSSGEGRSRKYSLSRELER